MIGNDHFQTSEYVLQTNFDEMINESHLKYFYNFFVCKFFDFLTFHSQPNGYSVIRKTIISNCCIDNNLSYILNTVLALCTKLRASLRNY